jgi:hypothetical protein
MIRQTKEYIENNHHCVYPVGHKSTDLDENDTVIVKSKTRGPFEIKVGDLSNISEELLIKTSRGWRKFIGVKPCV